MEIGDRPGTFSKGAVSMQEVQLAARLLFPEVQWDRQERHTIGKLTKTMVFGKTKAGGKVMLNVGLGMDLPLGSPLPYLSC